MTDEARYFVRELRDSDYTAVAAIQKANDPDQPVSVESLRNLFEVLLRASHPRQVVAEEGATGEVVGAGVVFQMPFEADPTRYWVVGGVLPDHRRRGVGSRLYDDLAAEVRRRGGTSLTSQVLESAHDGSTFLAKRGFVERRRHWGSRLELSSADTSELPALTHALANDGIELTTLAREGVGEPQVLTRLHEFYSEAVRDVPREGPYVPMPFDEFRQFFFGTHDALPDAWFLAKTAGRYVGVSQAAREAARPQVLLQNFTGTLPEFRRRKIALTLKLMVIDYAKRNGYSRIETTNDSLNAPMWTLNEGLGFRKVREAIQLETQLGGP